MSKRIYTNKFTENGFSWNVKIPSSLPTGSYVLRHEIIGLHSAGNANGAQNYPQVSRLQITPSVSELIRTVHQPPSHWRQRLRPIWRSRYLLLQEQRRENNKLLIIQNAPLTLVPARHPHQHLLHPQQLQDPRPGSLQYQEDGSPRSRLCRRGIDEKSVLDTRKVTGHEVHEMIRWLGPGYFDSSLQLKIHAR
jgi:hypothetical protein